MKKSLPDAGSLNSTDRGAPVGETLESPLETIERLRAELASERIERQKIVQDFDLVQRALDVAPSEFTISNMDEPVSTIVYCNRVRADNLGYTRAEAVGQPLTKFFARPNSEERHAQLRHELLSKNTIQNETVALRKDGSIYYRGSTVIPLENESGVVTHFVSIGADITARVEAERKQRELQEQLVKETKERERMEIELRLAQKLESVGRLAAGVAHEINTPIQYVGDSLVFLRSSFEDIHAMLMSFRAAYAALKENNDVPLLAQSVEAAVESADLEYLLEEVPRAFDRTFEGSKRVASIVRAMKEFAHPDSVEHAPADINHALQTTLIVASNEYKSVASVKTEFGELPPVSCNIGELNQVFLNLIVNAAHAIHDAGKDAGNGGEIGIATTLTGDAVEIIFADNGCGIPQDQLDKIYDPFFTTKEVGRGSGQGLTIARAIVVDKHDGDIRVESTTGVGTKFTLRLPISGKNSPT